MKPYVIDTILLIVILFELLMGLRRGLSGELFRLFGTCVVLVLGFNFYEKFGRLIAANSRLAENQEMALARAFILIVAGASLCFFLLRIVLHLLVTVKFNDAFDRPAGAAAGIIRGFLLAVLLVFAAGLWPNEQLYQMVTIDSYCGKTVFKHAPGFTAKLHSLQARIQNAAEKPAPEVLPAEENKTGERAAPDQL